MPFTPYLSGDNLPHCLRSEAAYHAANHSAENWQVLYLRYYRLSYDEMIQTGSLWAECQNKNQTEVINCFSTIPHGICSQDSRANIHKVLCANGIDNSFQGDYWL